MELAIEQLEGGEVSPYLVDELAVGDQLESGGIDREHQAASATYGYTILLGSTMRS